MIYAKRALSKKDQIKILFLLNELRDDYREFFITKNRIRLFIKENPYVLFNSLKKGDLIVFNDKGIALVIGFSDKAPRKYLKILSDNSQTAFNLLEVVGWNYNNELWAKVKRDNPIKQVLLEKGFYEVKGRGTEVLLKRDKKIFNEFIPNKE